MSIESAKFIVQRGASQFKCQGDELRDKLEVGDLMVVQHDGDDEASKWEAKGPPWGNHYGGVWHVKNPTNGPVKLTSNQATPGDFEAYDLDGNSLGQISEFNEELIFLTPPDVGNLFFNNNTGQNWEFGELTNTSRVTSMIKMFELCGAFNGEGLSDWDVSNVTNMLKMFHRAEKFNQDLSGWCVSQFTSKPTDFDFWADDWVLPRPDWGAPC